MMELEKISQITNEDITNGMNVAFFLFKNYFIYFLPGFITISLNNFIKGNNTEVNKKAIPQYFIISYIYNLLTSNKVYIIIISLIVPYILMFFRILNSKYDILGKLNIETSLSDNILDYIKSLETDKNNGIVLRIYLNTEDVMYEGKLRVHELRKDEDQLICLSGYREYIKGQNGKYIICKKKYQNNNHYLLDYYKI